MSKPIYQAIEIESHQPVGKPRNSVQFARHDARDHLERKGKHCIVCEIKVVFSTTELDIIA